MIMNRLYPLFLLLFFSILVIAQPELVMPKVPLNRQLFHLKIDEAQQNIVHLNGNTDSFFKVSSDEGINQQTNQILITHINNLQAKVELDSSITDNNKFTWLRSIENILTDFKNYYNQKAIKGIFLGDLILAYEQCMKLQVEKHQAQQ